MSKEFNAHMALSDTAKLRSIDVLHGEIRRERRKNARGLCAVQMNDDERRALLCKDALDFDLTEYK